MCFTYPDTETVRVPTTEIEKKQFSVFCVEINDSSVKVLIKQET